ncbi:unnamed protein product [Staurois parvus]|uniref:Uncharacterized protein n=1 Tax=Staurois parvus TaxID=386267 RepID=A0ABN9AQI0_9NEOB|nr:unnamed protein product [Staurois parvus]
MSQSFYTEVTSYHTPEDSHWREVISVF